MALHYRNVVANDNVNALAHDYGRIEVHPIAGALGAEIGGVDLSQSLDDATVTEIHQALLDHLVIFFRDQEITPEQHKAFGRHFGAFYQHEYVGGIDGHPEIMHVEKRPEDGFNFGGAWHTDITYAERPPMGSILYAHEVPGHGGDTVFANMYLAYETLSDGMKQMLGGLKAVHSAINVYGREGRLRRDEPEDARPAMKVDMDSEIEAQTEHPVVRTHPETGRKCLFVNKPFVIRLSGMEEDESEPLLRYLCEHATRLDFTCRFRWEKGSVAFWDNRCTQHYALNDYPGERRLMHRLTIQGDRPS